MIQQASTLLRKAAQTKTQPSAVSSAINTAMPMIRQFTASKEVPPKVMSNKSNAQKSDGASATSSAQGVAKKSSFESITRSQLTPGDLVFKAGTEKSNSTYQRIMAGQKETIIPKYTSNQHLLPVETHRVTHCDISVGDGLLAKVGGPRNKKEWAMLGKQTPTHYLPDTKLKPDSDEFLVLRPKNPEVAERMSERAKEVIDQGSNYSVPKLIGYYLNPHDRGEPETPSLTGNAQGPQPKPKEIDTELQCAEYTSSVVISSEREALRNDRTALESESINRTRISPAELIDTLVGSGNFDIHPLDLEDKKEKDT